MAPPAGAEPRSSHSPRRSAAAPPQCPGTVLTGLRSAGLGRRSVVCGPGGGGKVSLQVFCMWSVVGLNSLCLVGEAGG